MMIKEFFFFKVNRFFWINIIVMVVVVVFIVVGIFKGLDIYICYGEVVIVFDVKGMFVSEVEKMFWNYGLICVVFDFSYVKNKFFGIILDFNLLVG